MRSFNFLLASAFLGATLAFAQDKAAPAAADAEKPATADAEQQEKLDPEQQAIEALKELKVTLRRDESQPSRPVIAANMQKSKEFREKDLALLKVFPKLVQLQLATKQVTDEGLKTIGELKQLQDLVLSGTKVTNAGLKELLPLDQLSNLNLANNPRITDEGMKTIGQMQSLKILNLADTGVTDVGLQELAGLKSLTALFLSNTPTTLEGIEKFKASLPNVDVKHQAIETAALPVANEAGALPTWIPWVIGLSVVAVVALLVASVAFRSRPGSPTTEKQPE